MTTHNCLNRTFMELKFMATKNLLVSDLGLNRTFMELKCGKYIAGATSRTVLIEPLWN